MRRLARNSTSVNTGLPFFVLPTVWGEVFKYQRSVDNRRATDRVWNQRCTPDDPGNNIISLAAFL